MRYCVYSWQVVVTLAAPMRKSKQENLLMVLINIQLAQRRPALDQPLVIEPVGQVSTWYSVYGIKDHVDAVLNEMTNGFYWLHTGDYESFKDAVINSKHLYTYRIVKCDLIYHNGEFWGIKGTRL